MLMTYNWDKKVYFNINNELYLKISSKIELKIQFDGFFLGWRLN